MTHEHFSIHPEPVTALGKDFTASADHLDNRISAFASRAENVDDAFGVMSESTETLSQYVEMTRHTVTSLQQLRTGLQHYAAGLQHTVATYQASDAAQAQQFGGK
ncbi:type VII secretion target [Streptomyces sp. CB02959]|uniref:type VII secretion target n=1 Tax=Streptomyces sp. CB02959 TaxID=2020330 RepID=UPI000C27F6EC|nr:type VII secretion target [Streptomyces sp. CB02959]PJN38346.1 ESX-1 secretion-associated protein [Streptomyces sp. CB02959]